MAAPSRLRPPVQKTEIASGQWSARSHISIFVRCLHLLDLDLYEDWPGITESTLSAKTPQQNLQRRVRAVEWSLFRLFEILSPSTTQDKLRPFFPPQTSLQSMNLRAALLRSLTELKRNGVLGRDVVLRKTMFDDCKGDRFQELLAHFAMIVLRSFLDHNNADDPSAAYAARIAELPQWQHVPLLLAHRVCLQNTLARRNRIRGKAEQELESIAQDLVVLRDRRTKAMPQITESMSRKAQTAIDTFKSSFSGDSQWKQVILYEGKSQHAALRTEDAPSGEGESTGNGDPHLLFDLTRSLEKDSQDLSQWQQILASFPREVQTSKPPEVVRMPSEPPINLGFDVGQREGIAANPSDDARTAQPELLPPYAQLLQRMNEELRQSRPREPRRADPSKPASSADLRLSPSANRQKDGTEMSKPSIKPSTSDVERIEHDEHPSLPSRVPLPRLITESTYEEHAPALEDQNLNRDQLSKRPVESNENRVNHQGVHRGDVDDEANAIELSSPLARMGNETKQLSKPARDPRLTLTERTRQSMSLASRAHPPPKQTKVARERLSQHPVNQFETPRRGSQHATPVSPNSNDSTPREKLFSDEVDYTSVFKTRTKIAVSPVMSPDRSMLEDSLLRAKIEQLELEDI